MASQLHFGKLFSRPAAAIKAPARTRFAPSPTGKIHLGSLRTALYNYLLAHSTGGRFILRLEDTDRKRLVPGAESNIYDTLRWAGLNWDEGPEIGGPYGPYRQSERKNIYLRHAADLLKSGNAYRCFCSKDRLSQLAESARQLQPPSTASYDRKCAEIEPEVSESLARQGKSYVIRFRTPPILPAFEDVLHGQVSVQPQTNPSDLRFDDFVLLKSDGMPTYHFANVVDDHLMKITHVIRGEEWIPSTPKHVALYNAFSWTSPVFVHIPLLMGTGGKKLSKREDAKSVLDYRNTVLPEAFVNFVALQGWSPVHPRIGEKAREVMSLKEMTTLFSLQNLTKGCVQLDMSKLDFLNQKHFKANLEDPSALSGVLYMCRSACVERGLNLDDNELRRIFEILRHHISRPEEFAAKLEVLLHPNPAALSSTSRDVLNVVLPRLASVTQFDPTSVRSVLDVPFSRKQIYQSLRQALLGGHHGVSIVEALQVLGPNEVKARIQSFLAQNSNEP